MTGARQSPADRAPAPEGAERLAVGFTRALRAAGLPVAADAAVTYARALAAVGLGRRPAVYWAGRSVLVHRPEDAAAYDAVFERFWLAAVPASAADRHTASAAMPADGGGARPTPTTPPTPIGPGRGRGGGADVAWAGDDDRTSGDDGDPTVEAVLPLGFSRAEVLRHQDLARCTADELAEVHQLLAAVRLGGELRQTRHRRPTRRGDRPDLRGTLRRSLRTGGEPVNRQWLSRVERPRRVVLLCDVSGSMAPYARALLRFAQVAVAGRQRVEAFTIATRLTRVTRALQARDPDVALAAALAEVADWSGGTRLGETLATFNDRWGVPGLARGAVVVILSDGWDRGDPALLAGEMARLARVAHRVVWVNPLKATPGYAPLARGMAAALPHVDELVEGHSVASLAALAELVAGERRSPRADRVGKMAIPEASGGGG